MALSLSLTFKEMLSQKARLFLAIFAVAWGTASIAGMLAVGEGLRTSFGHAMNNAGPGLLYISPGKSSQGYHGTPVNTQAYITPDDLDLARKTVPNIKTITGEFEFLGMKLTYKNHKASYFSGRAVTPDYGTLRAITTNSPGRFINQSDMRQRRRVMVLGQQIAKWLFPQGHALGKMVSLDHWPFEVIGVAAKKIQMSNFGPSDDYQVWIPQTTYVSLSQDNHMTDWLILADNPDDNPAIEKNLRHLIALRHGFNPNDPGIVTSTNMYEYQQQSNRVFTGMQIFLGIVGSITLLVAGLGIANVMFVSVRRATRLIGVQMAMGARGIHILMHYLLQSLMVTLTGGAIGMAGAGLLIWLINLIPIHSDIFEMIGKPHPILSWGVLVSTVIVLTIIGLIAGYLPARKAAAINPVEALMYE
ncbi:MAG: ABC transporter permease [Coxiellaceae bacterium]|nr:ABC transporter permease [Coxiellaceae bacterium]